MPNTNLPFKGQCVKISEDTVNGLYVIQVDNAVGTGTTLAPVQKFSDADVKAGLFSAALHRMLKGLF